MARQRDAAVAEPGVAAVGLRDAGIVVALLEGGLQRREVDRRAVERRRGHQLLPGDHRVPGEGDLLARPRRHVTVHLGRSREITLPLLRTCALPSPAVPPPTPPR